jgi:ethanolamine utilization protein EutN
MKVGRVVATVVSTVHLPIVERRRLLLCDLLDAEGRATGEYTIAIDAVDAGAGERVLILDEGNSARQVLAAPEAPVRAVVVGIVDAVSLDGSGPETLPFGRKRHH